MRAVVIILGVLMFVAFAGVIVGLFTKIKHDTPPASSDTPVVFTLAPGAHIVSVEAASDRLVLHIRNVSGDEVDIIDTESGRLIGQVKPAPAAPKK